MKTIQVPKHLNKFDFHHKNGTFKQIYKTEQPILAYEFHSNGMECERDEKGKKKRNKEKMTRTQYLVVFTVSIKEKHSKPFIHSHINYCRE